MPTIPLYTIGETGPLLRNYPEHLGKGHGQESEINLRKSNRKKADDGRRQQGDKGGKQYAQPSRETPEPVSKMAQA